VTEAAFELLEPAHQSLKACRGRLVDHHAATYQTIRKRTMSSNQINDPKSERLQRSDKVELERVTKPPNFSLIGEVV
jgi:hypothetical protein